MRRGTSSKAYDSSASNERRYTYTYTTLDSVDRLTQVKAEVKTGGTWDGTPTGVREVGRVDYSYYSNTDSEGEAGDLKVVTVTLPLTDSGVDLVQKTYYRYYESDSWDTSTNPGYKHHLKLVVEAEGLRSYDWSVDSQLDADYISASTDTLKPYAAAWIEYDSSHRVRKAFFNGGCGCSGQGNGQYDLEYETNGSYTDNSGYDATWARRTVVKQPDGRTSPTCSTRPISRCRWSTPTPTRTTRARRRASGRPT
jgi:hypothetical protein